MQYVDIILELNQGRSVELYPRGNSMTPVIKSGQRIVLSPLASLPEKGDVVLAKVKGRYYIHKLTAIKGTSYQISNNHGHVNGWTNKVYGVVTEIGDRPS